MKPLYFYALFLSMFFLLHSCKKDNQPSPGTDDINKPDLETVDAVVYDDGGVTLKGRINKMPAGIKQTGFLLSSDSLLKNIEKITILKQLPPVGDFSAELNSGIIKDKRYYFSIIQYDSTGRYTAYNIKSFVATGSKRVKITNVSPLKADIGDTLTITGKYFSDQFISVLFDRQQGYIAAQNDSVLKVVISPYITSANPLLTLQYGGRTDTLSSKFSLYAPVVKEFTNTATFRDIVTINGDHFSTEASMNVVKFGNIKATVTKASKKQLQVAVPDDLEHSSSQLSITAQFQTTTGPGAFRITVPEITKATVAGKAGDPMIIEGKYFHPEGYRNVVILENTQVERVSGTSTTLTTAIPEGPYPQRTATIKVKVLDDIVTYRVPLKINDQWVVVSDKVPFDKGYTVGAFTVNGINYVIASVSYNEPLHFLWRFNPADFSWQKISMPFDFESGMVTSAKNKGYLFANKGNSSTFWEFDPANNSWTKKGNFTTGVRLGAALFAIDKHIYIGCGSSHDNERDDSFYEYDITQNTWKRIADYPSQWSDGVRYNASSFVLNGKAFVGGGASNTGMFDYYSYTPGIDTWIRVADFPDARSNGISFVINGQGYVAGGIPVGGSSYKDCYRYNASQNGWTKLQETVGIWPLGSDGIDWGFSFVDQGNVYIGCRGYGTNNFLLYQAHGAELR